MWIIILFRLNGHPATTNKDGSKHPQLTWWYWIVQLIHHRGCLGLNPYHGSERLNNHRNEKYESNFKVGSILVQVADSDCDSEFENILCKLNLSIFYTLYLLDPPSEIRDLGIFGIV